MSCFASSREALKLYVCVVKVLSNGRNESHEEKKRIQYTCVSKSKLLLKAFQKKNPTGSRDFRGVSSRTFPAIMTCKGGGGGWGKY